MSLIKHGVTAGIMLSCLAGMAQAQQDAVTVSYAGTALRDQFSGQPLSTTVNVTIDFKASAFTATDGHYSGTPSLSDVLSWSLSVGSFTLNSAGGALAISPLGGTTLPFIQITDGHVTGWALDFSGSSGTVPGSVILLSHPAAGLYFYDQVTEGGSFPPLLSAAAYAPGTWSVPSAVPEPGTAALFASGLALGAAGLRRRAHAPRA